MPLHFHPQMPVQPVIDAYYSGIGQIGTPLAGAAIGWYFDLQVIAGHWGEVVLFYLDHTARTTPCGGFRGYRVTLRWSRMSLVALRSSVSLTRIHRPNLPDLSLRPISVTDGVPDLQAVKRVIVPLRSPSGVV